MPKKSEPSTLSRQERRVIVLSMEGFGDKEVAQAMGVALGTVRTYWKRIGFKVGGGTRAEIVSTFAREESHRELQRERTLVARLRDELAQRRRAEERFRAICACSPLGLCVSDPEGSCRYANPAWERIAGRVAGGLREIVHPDDAPRLAAWWRESVLRGREDPIELRILTPAGPVRVRSASAPMLLDDRIAGYVGTIEVLDPGR